MISEDKKVEDIDMEEAVEDTEEAMEEEEAKGFKLHILPMTYGLHQKHGLRHNDYQVS